MHAMHLHLNFAGVPHKQLKNYRKFLSISLPSMCTSAPPLKMFLRGGVAVHRLLFVLWNNPLL